MDNREAQEERAYWIRLSFEGKHIVLKVDPILNKSHKCEWLI